MEIRYNEKIAEYREKIASGECDDSDLHFFMALSAPYIKEYHTEKKIENTGQTSALFKSRKTGQQRADIFEKYRSEVLGDPIPTKCLSEAEMFKCESCGSRNVFEDEKASQLICEDCGSMLYIQCTQVGYTERQDIEKTIVYSYKRENHFNEWIAQFQAKESTNVPSNVIEELRSEFKKQKIKNISEITHTKVKEFLKKLGFSKYYEHIPYITSILNGLKPPTMPQSLEDKLRIMFTEIEKAWETSKPTDRKNFLSYSYTLYKMCELLEEDEYLPFFQLLKSNEKLYKQDQMWKSICKELHWEWIKTV